MGRLVALVRRWWSRASAPRCVVCGALVASGRRTCSLECAEFDRANPASSAFAG